MTEADDRKAYIQTVLDRVDGMRVGFSMLMQPRDDLRNDLLLLSITSNSPELDSAARLGAELGAHIEAEIETIFAIQDRLKRYTERL